MKVTFNAPVFKSQLKPQVKSSQSFTGLWGEPYNLDVTDHSQGIDISDHVDYYYPFKNEKSELLDKLKESNNLSEKDDFDTKKRIDQFYNMESSDTKVCEELEFTEEEYNAYKKLNDKEVTSKDIEFFGDVLQNGVSEKSKDSFNKIMQAGISLEEISANKKVQDLLVKRNQTLYSNSYARGLVYKSTKE